MLSLIIVFSVCLSVCLFVALPTGVISVFINKQNMFYRPVAEDGDDG